MKTSLALLLTFRFLDLTGQVFYGAGGAIANNSGPSTEFTINVTGLTGLIDSTYGLEEVCINLTHPAVEELHVFLRSPSGIEVELSGMKSCKGANFSNTCFNHAMPNSVTIGTAPYSGTYRPLGNIGRFNRQQSGNGTWKLLVEDFISGTNTGSLTSWSLKFSNAPGKPVILSSSNLPLILIDTPGNQVLSDSNLLVDLGIIDNGANRNYYNGTRNNYNGKATCHIRGASSKMFEKNNLRLELKDFTGMNDISASLLGMPADSDWILTACYTDKTMIRNPLSQHLFRGMGHYSPRDKYVELIVNGEYFGVYILMEQIKRGNNRVDIDKMTSLDNYYPGITGGYIIQINRADDPGWYSLFPGVSANGAKFYYQYDYPNSNTITTQQKSYISNVLDSFETVMNGPLFANVITGYKYFINDDSFIDYLILNELSKNADAYKLSTFLYKNNFTDGGKINIGPVWDYDLAWHNCNFGNTFSGLQWQFEHNNSANPIPTWWKRLMEDPAFQNKLNCRYHSLRKSIMSDDALYQFIDDNVALLTEARERNFKQFPIIGAYVYANPQIQIGSTYTTEIADLKGWIQKRGAWLDANIPGTCPNVNVQEIVDVNENVKVFPNPFVSSIHVSSELFSESSVTIRFYDAFGNEVFVSQAIAENGIHTLTFYHLKPGVYLMMIHSGSYVVQRKVIKLE